MLLSKDTAKLVSAGLFVTNFQALLLLSVSPWSLEAVMSEYQLLHCLASACFSTNSIHYAEITFGKVHSASHSFIPTQLSLQASILVSQHINWHCMLCKPSSHCWLSRTGWWTAVNAPGASCVLWSGFGKKKDIVPARYCLASWKDKPLLS